MFDLCIAELGELVDGTVRLGGMPPLAGTLEPIGRIVFDPQQVQPRDVYWALRIRDYDGSLFVEDAFTRGALGVVLQGRRIEPWAGSFCVTVHDGVAALHRLMRCLHTDRGNWLDKLFASDEQTTRIVKFVWEHDQAALESEAAILATRGTLAA